jgi:hypothetical protein
MTSRERLLAASRSGEVDRKPTLAWMPGSFEADARVIQDVSELVDRDESGVVLADVPNPFGLALQRGIDLNKALKDDPSVGGSVLDGLVEEIRRKIAVSMDTGADGIFYRLHGATPKHCSPMQYGGHYLERDRELLDEVADANLNVLFVAGGEELYIDFVSDLPPQVFAWDSELSHVSADQVRSSRLGAVASGDPSSEILLVIGNVHYLENLEQPHLG